MSTVSRPDAPDTPGRPVPVLLIDDHRTFTDALRLGLDREPDLRCVGAAHTAHEALAQVSSTDVAVAVVDLDLPDAGGLDLIRLLRIAVPHLRVIVLTAHTRPDLAARAVAAGAVGFLGKDGTLARTVEAIRTATPRHVVVDPGLSPPGAVPADLTHREHEVLRHLGRGHDARRIAAELGISLHTTRGHIKSTLAKLGANSQLGAVVAAERLGLISLGSRY